MNLSDVRNYLIPLLKAHTGVSVIEADQGGEIPDGNHAVYKFTVPYSKEVGRPNVSYDDSETYNQIQSEDYRITLSVTAISEDNDDSTSLAQNIHDWFTFYGEDSMQSAGIVPVSVGDLGNRDSVNDDETRQGFDVILRLSRELTREIGYYDKVLINE